MANKLSTVAVGDAIRLNNIGYNSNLNCLWVSTGTNASVYLPITWQQNDNIKMVTGIIYETNTHRLGIYANGGWHYITNVA